MQPGSARPVSTIILFLYVIVPPTCMHTHNLHSVAITPSNTAMLNVCNQVQIKSSLPFSSRPASSRARYIDCRSASETATGAGVAAGADGPPPPPPPPSCAAAGGASRAASGYCSVAVLAMAARGAPVAPPRASPPVLLQPADSDAAMHGTHNETGMPCVGV